MALLGTTRPGQAVADAATRERDRHGASGRIHTDELLQMAGHDVRIKPLRAAEGGLEACVVELVDGAFRFVCDDAPSPVEPEDIAQLDDPRQFRVSFRLAHELAHTSLRCVSFGARRGRHSSSVVETRCDEFAVLFLVDASEAQAAVRDGDHAVRLLARGLNVPTRMVRSAATAAE